LRNTRVTASVQTYVFSFTTQSHAACYLDGYPSVTATSNLIRSSVRQFPLVEVASRVAGAKGKSSSSASQSVWLRPGSWAYALLTLQPKMAEAGIACPTYDILSVQMPESKKTNYFKVNISACDSLEIHPIVSHISEVPGSVVV